MIEHDDRLYLTIVRGGGSRPIVATSDPDVLRATARALFEMLCRGEDPDVEWLREALSDEELGAVLDPGPSAAEADDADLVRLDDERIARECG